MGKTVRDYLKTIIYMIQCKNPDITDVYIGSTTNINNRMSLHKSVCNNPSDIRHNFKLYQVIRENGGWHNFEIIKLEHYPCINSDEQALRELHWINNLKPTLNKQIPRRTQKQYYRDNCKKIIETSKNYYVKFKDRYLEYAKTKCECVCGVTYNKSGKTMHLRTDKHMNFIKNTQSN